MVFRFLIVLAAGLTLSACATSEGYRQQMTGYIGASADYLVLDFGSPIARDALSNGAEVWSFLRREQYYDPGGYISMPVDRRVSYRDRDGRVRHRIETYYDHVYTPPRQWMVDCETRFVVRENIVTDFRFEGSGCVAPES